MRAKWQRLEQLLKTAGAAGRPATAPELVTFLLAAVDAARLEQPTRSLKSICDELASDENSPLHGMSGDLLRKLYTKEKRGKRRFELAWCAQLRGIRRLMQE